MLNPTLLKITPGSNKFDGRYVEEKIVSSIVWIASKYRQYEHFYGRWKGLHTFFISYEYIADYIASHRYTCRRWQRGGCKRKRRKSCGKVAIIVFFSYFCKSYCSIGYDTLWVERSREGDALHYEKALLTLCFWSFWNYHFPNHGREQCRGNCHVVCISDTVVCCEDTCILISTLYGVSIYLNVGVSLSVYCDGLW